MSTVNTHIPQGARFSRPLENYRYEDKKLECVDPQTDEVVWSADLPSAPKGCIAVTEDSVACITVGGGERITCLDRETGKSRWSQPFIGQTMMKSAYAHPSGEVLTFDNNDLSLHSFNEKNGHHLWKAPIGDYMKGVPTGPAGVVLVARHFGDTVQLDPATGDRIR